MSSGIAKPRAARCHLLDDYQIEIAYMYCVQRWSVNKIKAYFETEYQVSATKKQFEGRIRAWRLRKNVKADEWDEIDRQLLERESSKKKSKVIVGTIDVSDSQLLRGRKRHVSFTQRVMRAVQSNSIVPHNLAPPIPMAIDVSTPSDPDSPMTLCSSPTPGRDLGQQHSTALITLRSKNWPSILQHTPNSFAATILVKILEQHAVPKYNMPFEITSVRTTPVFAFLRSLVYFLSNTWDRDPFRAKFEVLWDKVVQLKYTEALITLLSQESALAQFCRENLLYICYLKGDLRFLKFMHGVYKGSDELLFGILKECMNFVDMENQVPQLTDYQIAYHQSKRSLDRKMDIYFSRQTIHLLRALLLRNATPEDGQCARLLLCASKFVAKDVTTFFELWDPKVANVCSIDYIHPDEPGSLYNWPLYALDDYQLEIFFDYGFKAGASLRLLKSLLDNEIGTTRLILKRSFSDVSTRRENPRYAWELIDEDIFQKIITSIACGDDFKTYSPYLFGHLNFRDAKAYQFGRAELSAYLTFLPLPQKYLDICLDNIQVQLGTTSLPVAKAIDNLTAQILMGVNTILPYLSDVSLPTVVKGLKLLRQKGIFFEALESWKAALRYITAFAQTHNEGLLELLDLLIDVGVGINAEVHPCRRCYALDTYTPIKCWDAHRRALEVALQLEEPFWFLYLIAKGADTSGISLPDSILSRIAHFSELPRNYEVDIRQNWAQRRLWRPRFQTKYPEEDAYFGEGDITRVRDIWASSTEYDIRNPFSLLRLVREIIWKISNSSFLDEYGAGIELIKVILDKFENSRDLGYYTALYMKSGFLLEMFNSDHLRRVGSPEKILQQCYENIVRFAIKSDVRLDYLPVMIEKEPPFEFQCRLTWPYSNDRFIYKRFRDSGQQDQSYRCCFDNIWKTRIIYAATGYRAVLIYIIEDFERRGGNLDSKELWATCLVAAIQAAKIDIIIFLLDKGADMHYRFESKVYMDMIQEYCCHSTDSHDNILGGFQPCLRIVDKTPVEYAMQLGRIDAVTLFLEFDPSCRDILLAKLPVGLAKPVSWLTRDAGKNVPAPSVEQNELMRDYIENWKPGVKLIQETL